MLPLAFVLALALTLAPALPAAASSLSWSSPQLIDHRPPFTGGHFMDGVSCRSQSLCLAVDTDGGVLSSTDPTGGEAAWEAAAVAPGEYLHEVSCPPSSSLCVAVGERSIFTSTDPTGGAGSWQRFDFPLAGEALTAVSCPTASFCAVVDSDGNVLTSTDPTAGASAWHMAGIDPGFILRGVSCPSSSLCVAVDWEGRVLTSTDPTAGAGAWQLVDPIGDSTNGLTAVSCPSASLCALSEQGGLVLTSTDPTGGAGAWDSIALPTFSINSVSCPSEQFCAAIGDNSAVFTSTDPTDGGSWSAAPTGSETYLGDIACTAATFCLVGGAEGRILTSTDPLGEPPVWSVAQVDGFDSLYTLSCPSSSLCVTADGEGNVLASTDPAGGAATWSSTVVDPPAGSGKVSCPSYQFSCEGINALSCPSASFCAAVDGRGDVLTSTDPGGEPPSWSSPVNLEPGKLVEISCPSASFCAAVDEEGNVLTSTDPSGEPGDWMLTTPEHGAYLESISCPSISLCVAVGFASNGEAIAVTSTVPDLGAWSVTAFGEELNLGGVSCPLESFCVAVGGSNVVTSTTPAAGGWHLVDLESPAAREPEIFLYRVSCPSTSFCAATDTQGDVVSSHDPSGPASGWDSRGVAGYFSFGSNLLPVSCPSSLFCAMSSNAGYVLTATGDATKGSISGVVRNAADSSVLGGVEVCARNAGEEGGCTTTGGSGGYSIEGLDPGSYRVVFAPADSDSPFLSQYFDHRSDPSEADPVQVAAGEAVGGVDADLEEGGRIEGTVTDASTHEGIPGIDVCAYREGVLERCTVGNADGEYTVSGLSSSYYEIEFSAPSTGIDYFTQYYDGASSLQGAELLSAPPGVVTTGIDAELERASRIEGTVTDGSGAGIEGVEACAYEAQGGPGEESFEFLKCASTDAAGEYSVSGLATGTYKIRFRPGPGVDYVGEYYDDAPSLEAADAISVTAGSDATGIDAELGEGARIEGRAIDAVSKDPIAGIEVCAHPGLDGESRDCVSTDGDGEYALLGLPAGTYVVGFSAVNYEEGTGGPNYITQYYDGEPSPQAADPVTVSPGSGTTGVDAEMHEGGRIEGTVVDAGGGQAIQGVTVCAFAVGEDTAERCSYTDAGGEYGITGLASGEYKVEFFEGNRESRTYLPQYYDGEASLAEADPVSVAAGAGTTGVNAELVEGGMLEGELFDISTIGPVEEPVEVCLLTEDGDVVLCTWTGEEGRFLVTGLEEGLYKVMFSPGPDEGYSEDEFETRYFEEEESLADATPVSVSVGALTPGITAFLYRPPTQPPVAVGSEPPSIAGTPAVGSVLFCSQGEWENHPKQFAYRWLRDGAPISGEASSAYTVSAADQGHSISCEVTATNDRGSASEAAAPVQVPAAPGPPGEKPGGGGGGSQPPAGGGGGGGGGGQPPAKGPPKCGRGFKKKTVGQQTRCVRPKHKKHVKKHRKHPRGRSNPS